MEKRVLIARWLGSDTQPIPIYDEASVSSARQRVREAGHRLNLGKEFVESVCVVARKFETRTVPLCCEIAIMGRPYPQEAISGDDGVFFQSESECLAAVSDGLGHGPEARQASNRAIEALTRNRQMDLDQIGMARNGELGGTS